MPASGGDFLVRQAALRRAIKADTQATRQLRDLIATDKVIVLLPLDGQPAAKIKVHIGTSACGCCGQRS